MISTLSPGISLASFHPYALTGVCKFKKTGVRNIITQDQSFCTKTSRHQCVNLFSRFYFCQMEKRYMTTNDDVIIARAKSGFSHKHYHSFEMRIPSIPLGLYPSHLIPRLELPCNHSTRYLHCSARRKQIP